MSFHITNADLMEIVRVRPSQTQRGQVIELNKPVGACSWLPSEAAIIPAGSYRIISRKHFTGGAQEIEKEHAR